VSSGLAGEVPTAGVVTATPRPARPRVDQGVDHRLLASIDARRQAFVDRVLARPGVVVLLGGIDSGKTTLARLLLSVALAHGHEPVLVDLDLGQSTVGPPTTVGLRHLRSSEDLADPFVPDELYFVGSTSPRAHLLPLLAGTARLLQEARRRATLIVVDTSGLVAGTVGQVLKFHKLELARPRHVAGLQRGAELEPLLGVARRFTSAEVTALPVHPAVVATGAQQRAEHRRERLARYFSAPLHRYQVCPLGFMPPLPRGLDHSLLQGLLVGVNDRSGSCLGVGVLEHGVDALRLVTPASGAPSGLRLGSTRVDVDWRATGTDLRTLFRGG
jgi:polynucleotide 5'-hydroxyl-kinase GRC3/NOL9